MVAKFINGSSFVIKIIEPAAKSIKSIGRKVQENISTLHKYMIE